MGKPPPYDPLRAFAHQEGCGCVVTFPAPHRENRFRFCPCHCHDPKWTEAMGWGIRVAQRGWAALEKAREEAGE